MVVSKGKFLWCVHADCASYCAKVSKVLVLKMREMAACNKSGNGFVLVSCEG